MLYNKGGIMNSEEINEMFEAFEKSDNKKLLELAEIEVNDDKIEEYTRNNRNEILSRLMAKIENANRLAQEPSR